MSYIIMGLHVVVHQIYNFFYAPELPFMHLTVWC